MNRGPLNELLDIDLDAIVLTAGRARIHEYAVLQDLRDQRRAIKSVLDRTAGTLPPREVVVPYWRNVMEGGASSDSSASSGGVTGHPVTGEQRLELEDLWVAIRPDKVKELEDAGG